MRALIINKDRSLELRSLETPLLQSHEILVEHTAIEVNHLDALQIQGLIPVSHSIPGSAAVGIVKKIGAEVKGFKVGDKVAYILAPGGAYANINIVPQNLTIAIDSSLPDEIVAATLTKSLIAHTLCQRTYIPNPKSKVLVNGAAGGVGQLLVQYLLLIGATIVCIVESASQRQWLYDLGIKIVMTEKEFTAKQYKDYFNVFYDCLGWDVTPNLIDAFSTIGLFVSYGSKVGKIDLGLLAQKSLFWTKPSISHYKVRKVERLLTIEDILHRIHDGEIKAPFTNTLPLSEASQALNMLNNKERVGAVVLIP